MAATHGPRATREPSDVSGAPSLLRPVATVASARVAPRGIDDAVRSCRGVRPGRISAGHRAPGLDHLDDHRQATTRALTDRRRLGPGRDLRRVALDAADLARRQALRGGAQ